MYCYRLQNKLGFRGKKKNNVGLGDRTTALRRIAPKQVLPPATTQGMGYVCFNKFSLRRRKRGIQGSKEDKGRENIAMGTNNTPPLRPLTEE
jgi:hypothetical protein